MERDIGGRLATLLASADRDVLIVAPFIQRAPFERLLNAIPPGVNRITCVTRWLPEDVAAGVSDLDVLDSVVARPGASLLLHAQLHAKLFRADDRQLVGSANVTGRALGWSAQSNVELLIPVAAEHRAALEAFEARLIRSSIPATEELREAIRMAATKFASAASIPNRDVVRPAGNWIPSCPSPDRLWSIYANDSAVWQVITSAVDAGRADLEALGVPKDLPRPVFEQFVRSAFELSLVMREIDRLAARGLEAVAGLQVIKSLSPDLDDLAASAGFEIALRWMEHFVPNTYRRVPMSEVFHKGRELP